MRIRTIILATLGAVTLAGCAYDRYGYGYGDRYDGYHHHHHHHHDRDGAYVGGDYHPR